MPRTQRETVSNLRASSAAVIRNDCAKILRLAGVIDAIVRDGGTLVVSSANQLAGLSLELSRHAALLSALGDLEKRE